MSTTPNHDLATTQGHSFGKTAPILGAWDSDACNDIATAIAPPTEHAICDVCKEPVTDGCGAWDEDDMFWCVPCMLKWEKEHGRHWENGQPMKEETK